MCVCVCVNKAINTKLDQGPTYLSTSTPGNGIPEHKMRITLIGPTCTALTRTYIINAHGHIYRGTHACARANYTYNYGLHCYTELAKRKLLVCTSPCMCSLIHVRTIIHNDGSALALVQCEVFVCVEWFWCSRSVRKPVQVGHCGVCSTSNTKGREQGNKDKGLYFFPPSPFSLSLVPQGKEE